MTKPGIEWATNAEFAQEAKEIIRRLVVVLSAFSFEMWDEIAGEVNLTRVKEKGLFELQLPLGLEEFLEDRLLDFQPHSSNSLLRTILQPLIAAEEIDLPMTYIMTLLAVAGPLRALSIAIEPLLLPTVYAIGSWAHTFEKVELNAHSFFMRVIGLRHPEDDEEES